MSFWDNMNVDSEFPASEDQHTSNDSVVTNAAAMRASSTQVGGSNDTEKERSAEAPPNTSLKRLACDACRERKVRCDRQHPTCSRCARLGHKCNYSGPSKQAASKMDLSQFLMTLHTRLTQAEAQIALSSSILNMNPFAVPWSDPAVTPLIASAEAVSGSQLSPTQVRELQELHLSLNMPVEGLNNPNMGDAKLLDSNSNNKWLDQQQPDTSALQFSGMASTISTDFSVAQSASDTNQIFDINSASHGSSSSSHSEARSLTASTISIGLLSRLHTSFFDVFYPIMPIVNQTRFQAEMAHASYTIEVQALSHVIGALGALAMTEFACVHEKCYNQARDLLDICERQETGKTLININTLQTCVLLTLYEFKRTNFARAWMTLGRAIRLAKMMGLDRIDSHSARTEPSGLHLPLPPTSNPAELEERRRTFWLLYIFDAFAAIRTNSVPAIDELEIYVPLPSPCELPDITEDSNMPSLRQFSELSESFYLSSFAGTIVMIFLYRRCFDHIRDSIRQAPSYPFWVTHYRIDRSIRDCRNNLLAQSLVGSENSDPLTLTMRMNLAAVEICLHEAAIAKVDQEQLPASLSNEATNRCKHATTDTIEAVQLSQQLRGQKLEAFRQSSPFFIWPITMAIQACFRMLSNEEHDVSTHINSLRILASSMRELIDAEHIPSELLAEVDLRIAEAERPNKRRRI